MRNILMIGTGGTIASVKGEHGLEPGGEAITLLDRVPEAVRNLNVDVKEAFALDSTDIQPKQWEMLAQMIENNYEKYDGFVICHGTDTLAYGAAALYFLIQNSPKPIVVTGSQHPMGEAGSDAVKNLADSFCYASDPESHGVVVVFDGSVIRGDSAKKLRTQSVHAFESVNREELAQIADGEIRRNLKTPEQKREQGQVEFYHHLASDAAIVKLYPGMSGGILENYFRCCRGLVIEGFGMGGIPAYLMETFEDCMERYQDRCRVVLATQVLWEGTDLTQYEVAKRIADKFPVEACGEMMVEAALMKLMWLLGSEE